MSKRLLGLTLSSVALLCGTATAQSVHDLGVLNALRAEEAEGSRIEELAHTLVEVIGPRLTGSQALRQAEEWVADSLRGWGLSEVRVEPWGEFGRSWEVGGVRATMTAPFRRSLQARPIAWTGGTEGPVEAPVVSIPVADTDPTGLSMPDVEAIAAMGDRLKGAIALIGPLHPVEMDTETPEPRWDADDLLPDAPFDHSATPTEGPDMMEQIDELLADIANSHAARDRALREAGVVAVLTPSERVNGALSGSGHWAGIDPEAPVPLPELVIAAEQFNEMKRNAEAGVEVRVALDVENSFGETVTEANVLGDLPGSEHPEELVMIGAHLDSWHLAGGATDNAAGSIVMMEAMRLLRAVGARPKRTIRIALWTGEEQGLYGSRRWLEQHPELHDRISAYLNMDNGTGRIRGLRSEGRGALIDRFEDILVPLKDLGVVGVIESSSGGSDHLPFQAAGIPGFSFLQDPIEYSRRTHHSALDGYDHLVLDDLKQAAVVIAWLAYRLAMEDELLPRG